MIKDKWMTHRIFGKRGNWQNSCLCWYKVWWLMVRMSSHFVWCLTTPDFTCSCKRFNNKTETVFWDVMPQTPVGAYWNFRDKRCFHHLHLAWRQKKHAPPQCQQISTKPHNITLHYIQSQTRETYNSKDTRDAAPGRLGTIWMLPGTVHLLLDK